MRIFSLRSPEPIWLLRCCAYFASSSSIFGQPEYLPIDEAHPTNPTSPYGVSKLAAEQAIGDRLSLLGNRLLLAVQDVPLEPICL